jgi:phage baseplate assembly protein W
MALNDDEFFSAPQDAITSNVVWLDVNTRMSEDGRPDLLPNVRALVNSLFNLFQCPIGARGPIFEPEYGSILYYLLQEPHDFITATKLKIAVTQAVQRWERRIEIDINRTVVLPDYNRNAFDVTLVFSILATQELGSQRFLLNRG